MHSPGGFTLYLLMGDAINIKHFMENMTDEMRAPVDRLWVDCNTWVMIIES